MTRTTNEVLTDLGELIYSHGYIYTLCLILFEDFHHDLDKIHLVDPNSKLSVKECSLILGFLVQQPIDFSFPKKPEDVITLKERTYALMRELQMSFSAPQFQKLREMLEQQENGEALSDKPEDKLDFFVKDGAMIEPTFYAGDGVYDFQYIEFLERKYKYDQEWLSSHKNFEIKEVCNIVNSIKNVLHEKAKQVNLLKLEETFPKIIQKAKKKLIKLYSKEEFKKIEREQFIAATFFQYQELFPLTDQSKKDHIENWEHFYGNLLDLFVIRSSDFGDGINVECFLQNFSFIADCNSNYQAGICP